MIAIRHADPCLHSFASTMAFAKPFMQHQQSYLPAILPAKSSPANEHVTLQHEAWTYMRGHLVWKRKQLFPDAVFLEVAKAIKAQRNNGSLDHYIQKVFSFSCTPPNASSFLQQVCADPSYQSSRPAFFTMKGCAYLTTFEMFQAPYSVAWEILANYYGFS